MFFLQQFTTLLFLSAVSLTNAHPCHRPPTSSQAPSSTVVADIAAPSPTQSIAGVTPEQIKAIAPDTATCDGTASCRTAEEAAPFINESFQKYNITTVGEQAALISLMLFESGNFRFDVNLFPGRPGQGTRNMMIFDFILPYALQNNATAVQAIRPDLTSTSTVADVPDDDEKNEIRATVLSNSLSFGSAAWFLRERCPPSVAEALQTGSDDGFNTYMGTECINAGQDPARLQLYQATLSAMTP